MTDAELAWLAAGEGTAAVPPRTAEPVEPRERPAPARARERAPKAAGGRRRVLAAATAATLALAILGAGTLWFRSRAPALAPPRPAPAPVPIAEAAPVPVPVPVAPAPAPDAASAAEPAAVPEVASPAPVATRARAAAPAGRARQDLRIARKDQKLLDLLDRKADAAPAATVEPASLDTATAALDGGVVERTVADNAGAFASCVTKAVKANPRLRVDDRKVTLLLTVEPTGAVSSTSLAEPDVERSSLGRCLLAAARRVVFPSFRGDAIDVAVPLALSAVR
jgi:hypothetical protein